VQTIVWDVDDVLNNLTENWFRQKWLVKHPGCPCRFEDLTANPPHERLGVSLSEYLSSLDEFRLASMVKLSPNPEVVQWFEQYGHRYRHAVLTATPLHTVELSAYWVMHHFGRWIRSFHFVPSEREGQEVIRHDRTKGEFLSWLGKADIFIDDSPANIKQAQAAGITAYLVSRPWSDGGMTCTAILNELQSRV
jgi:hypothetical protein